MTKPAKTSTFVYVRRTKNIKKENNFFQRKTKKHTKKNSGIELT